MASVAARWPRSPSYFHSFGMSENYYILAEQPLSSNVLAMLCRKFTGASFLDNLKFHDKEQVHVHIHVLPIRQQVSETINERAMYAKKLGAHWDVLYVISRICLKSGLFQVPVDVVFYGMFVFTIVRCRVLDLCGCGCCVLDLTC